MEINNIISRISEKGAIASNLPNSEKKSESAGISNNQLKPICVFTISDVTVETDLVKILAIENLSTCNIHLIIREEDKEH